MKARSIFFILIAFIIVLNVESRTFDYKRVWFQRPYKGPEVLIEVIGADLNYRANRVYDFWSKPDPYVVCHHGKCKRKTQIEGNTYRPRYLWQSKLPYKSKMGFRFDVLDANVIKDDEGMGRAFLSATQAKDLIKKGGVALLSLGENIGQVKIQISRPPPRTRRLDTKAVETGLRLPQPKSIMTTRGGYLLGFGYWGSGLQLSS